MRKNSYFSSWNNPYEKRGDNEPVCIADEVPFEIPESWEWVKLGELCDIINGFTPLRTNPIFWENATVSWFTVDDIHSQGRRIFKTNQYINQCALSKDSNRVLPPKSILLCCTASVGEYAITEIPLTTNQQFNGLIIKEYYRKYYSPEFLFKIAYTFKDRLINLAGKTTFNFISVKKLSELVVPFPPLSEQHRIVSKIEELLPLISEYEKAETQLTALNTSFPAQLKKSILQQAIQGKLVPQDPDDEPASKLLERIRAEKQELIKAGKIKKDKNESVIFKRDNSHYELCGGVERCIDDEIPFDIPETWAWCRLNNCCIDIADIDHKMPEQVENGIPYISPLNFTDNNGIDYDRAKKISYTDYEKLAVKCTPECDDIIFPRYGTIGVLRYITTNRKFLVSYSCATIKPSKTYSLPIYIYYVLHSPWIQNNEIMRYINKTTQPNIGLQSIKNFLIPFPPLSEQKRIVSKIEELIPLIQTL